MTSKILLHADAYSGERPSKAEFHLSRLNLQSVDPSLQSGCSGEAPTISAGEIAAAIAFGKPYLPLTWKYVSAQAAKTAMTHLLYAKYMLNKKSRDELNVALFTGVFLAQLMEQEADIKVLCAQVALNRGTMRACVDTVIDDVCRPSVYANISARAWARQVGLANHKQWQSLWKSRYENLRIVVQEMDNAIIELIEKRL